MRKKKKGKIYNFLFSLCSHGSRYRGEKKQFNYLPVGINCWPTKELKVKQEKREEKETVILTEKKERETVSTVILFLWFCRFLGIK